MYTKCCSSQKRKHLWWSCILKRFSVWRLSFEFVYFPFPRNVFKKIIRFFHEKIITIFSGFSIIDFRSSKILKIIENIENLIFDDRKSGFSIIETFFRSSKIRIFDGFGSLFQSELGLQNHRVQSPRWVLLKIEDRLQKYFFSSKFYGLHLGGNYRSLWSVSPGFEMPILLCFWVNPH